MMCVELPVFKMTANSYNPFASYAASTGMSAAWTPWSADEQCDQASATDDVVLPVAGLTPWCSLTANGTMIASKPAHR